MAVVVREIMNEELFAVSLRDTVADTVASIVALQITAAPLLDEGRRPRGMVALRDLLDAPPTLPAAACATPDFAVVRGSDSLSVAARTIAESGQHQLIVVDGEGRAIGIVSAFDVVRALVGAPVGRPRAFPHFDGGAEVTWSDDTVLDARNVARAPSAAGVVALVLGGAARTERVMWAEACEDVRHRLEQVLRGPIHEIPGLARSLASGRLRFRVAIVSDPKERERVLAIVLGRAMADLLSIAPGVA